MLAREKKVIKWAMVQGLSEKIKKNFWNP